MAINKEGNVIIPRRYDPNNGTLPAFREDFDVSREHRIADHIRDHNHTIDQADEEGGALKNGRRRLSHRSPEQSLVAKRKKDKDRFLMRMALKQLMARLEDLYRDIAIIDQRLEEIQTEMTELEYLMELAANNKFDLDNSDHARLLKKYGTTQDDINSGNVLIMLNTKLGQRVDEQSALQKRKASLQEQANEAIGEAHADGIISVAEADQFRQRLESSEAEVSAIAWDSDKAANVLQDMASEVHKDHIQDERVDGELNFAEPDSASSTLASQLDGDASYKKGIKSQGEDISIKEQFAVSVSPIEKLTQSEQALPNTSTPGQKPT